MTHQNQTFEHDAETYILTTNHAASSYGQPVIVTPDGTALGPNDIWRTAAGHLVSGARLHTLAAIARKRDQEMLNL
jgi:hypothetical protein